MTIEARRSREITAVVQGAPTGLTGTLGVRITDEDAVVVTARTTAGIVESPSGSGTYRATLTTPDENGDYLITWDTGGGSPQYASEVLTVSGSAEWAPTVDDVAAILPARADHGTFDENTRPTDVQVEVLIDRAMDEIAGRIGGFDILSDHNRALARDLAAIRAAMGVELGYYPEQTNTDRSAYENLRELYETGLEGLIGGIPDSDSTRKGLYSVPMRTEMSGAVEVGELLP